ncbi:hypothetical protein Dsin_022631 [Dipteronia sinensis]|uniref:DUF4283 domain-containing protein n=1 Tax=Dipteronia sinensis TaxID=43782 RepID=A0AAE0A381_9ROSI|nr:hypothetical protein Dsin_022631 [Dipteronia sinensis]
MIIFDEPVGDGDIRNMKFNRMEFWVQIHNIPLLCMTEEIGIFLGQMIGEVRGIDLEPAKEANGCFIRCGRLGHTLLECSAEGDNREIMLEANMDLNVWLRTVSPLKRFPCRNGIHDRPWVGLRAEGPTTEAPGIGGEVRDRRRKRLAPVRGGGAKSS